jgi:hypothetical protein
MDVLKRFFAVVIRGRSYLNALYLLLAFPLGMLYFVLLITGFSLAVGLWVLWVGIFLMALVVALWWGLAVFERKMAIWLLGEDIPPMHRPDVPRGSFLEKVKAHFGNPVTWKSLGYLVAKFPLGVITFTIAITLISLAAGLVAAPFVYQAGEMHLGFTEVDTLWKALLCSGAGLIFFVLGLHAMNILATVSGRFARLMLGTRNEKRIQPVEMRIEAGEPQPEVS